MHSVITAVLSITLIAIGVAMLITTIAKGGGPLAYGVIVGICFVAAGAARLWLAVRGPRR
jgi:hypothetical protein